MNDPISQSGAGSRKVKKPLSKHKRRKQERYDGFTDAELALLRGYPKNLWSSYKKRWGALSSDTKRGVSFSDFLRREALIDSVEDKQLGSVDPTALAQKKQVSNGGWTQNLFSRLG
jgi:hypothetical protein